MGQFVRTTTVDDSETGDSVKQAVLDVDADLTGIIAAYNTHDTATTDVHGCTGAATGTGALVRATSPTLVTPTIGAASGTSLTLSGLTASLPVFTDGSKNLVSNTMTGTGKVVMDTSPTISAPTISGHPVIEGVTPTGATGSGKLVFDTSPTLVTPVLGAASGTSLTLSGLTASLPVFTDGSKKLVSKSVADTLTALGVGAWTDYSASSTITGWSSFTDKHIEYKTICGIAFVIFSLGGTGNFPEIRFTLPAVNAGYSILFPVAYALDAGNPIYQLEEPQYATGSLLVGSNEVKIDIHNLEGGWLAGDKVVSGQFFYFIA